LIGYIFGLARGKAETALSISGLGVTQEKYCKLIENYVRENMGKDLSILGRRLTEEDCQAIYSFFDNPDVQVIFFNLG
jgi:hypothetical protein